jgi:rSAM/selenodomain-associated transferase 2
LFEEGLTGRDSITFVVPALNEAASIERALEPLASRLDPSREEILVVDGGSEDGTAAIARGLGPPVRVVSAPRGRASQMNAGAREARGALLVFVHADTRFPPRALAELRGLAHDRETRWGFFPIRLDDPSLSLRLIELGIKIRVLAGGFATGDQAIFVRRTVFHALGGYRLVPLMEDVELARRLGRIYSPDRPRTAIFTSARRWTRQGIARTQLRMWGLRLAWRLGVAPEVLSRFYPQVR